MEHGTGEHGHATYPAGTFERIDRLARAGHSAADIRAQLPGEAEEDRRPPASLRDILEAIERNHAVLEEIRDRLPPR